MKPLIVAKPRAAITRHLAGDLRTPDEVDRALYRLMSAEPLNELRELNKRIQEHGIDGWNNDALTSLYALSCLLRLDTDSWLSFCQHPSWATDRERPQFDAHGEALFFAARFVNGRGAASASLAKKVSTLLKAAWDAQRPARQVALDLGHTSRPTPMAIWFEDQTLSKLLKSNRDQFSVAAEFTVLRASSRGHRTAVFTAIVVKEVGAQADLPL